MEHYRSIVITLLIIYAIINSPRGAMDMLLALGASGSAYESRSEHNIFRTGDPRIIANQPTK